VHLAQIGGARHDVVAYVGRRVLRQRRPDRRAAYALGSAGKTGAAAAAGGAAGVGRAALGAALSPLRKAAASLKDSYRSGGRAAVTATGGTISGGSSTPTSDASAGAPAWVAAMKRRQTMTHGATVAAHTLRSGDGGGSGASVDLNQKD